MVWYPDMPGRLRSTGNHPEPKFTASSATTNATVASAVSRRIRPGSSSGTRSDDFSSTAYASSRASSMCTCRACSATQRHFDLISSSMTPAMLADMGLTVVDHPLVSDRVAGLRDAETGSAEFRRLTAELSTFLAYEA